MTSGGVNAGDVVVRVAPGGGRIARRSGALLFDPSGGNADLIALFAGAADDDAALTSIKQELIKREFATKPLVAVDWRAGVLDLLIFGDTDLHSSAAAAPMISGAGSSTWVERHLGSLELADSAAVELWSGDDSDPSTNLQLGVVHCGGFGLSLVLSDVASQALVDGAAAGALPVDEPRPVAPMAAQAPPVEAGFVADPAKLDWTDTEPKHAPERASTADPFDVPAPRMPADIDDPVTEVSGDVRAVVESTGVGLVESSACANGHNNPPRSSICLTCAAAMNPDALPVPIEQPTAGYVRFSDGRELEMSGTYVIGRKPASDDGSARLVTLDNAEVSRTHVEISVEGWAVLVKDLGSRNGTWVVPPSDPTPVRLDTQIPYLLEHGTTVHLGGSDASFSYDFGID